MFELIGYQWLDHHLETFVRPKLKSIPAATKKDRIVDYQLEAWTPKHLKGLQGLWFEAKKRSKGRRVLLAGRDVYLFEVLARLEGFPTIFRSDISGPVARQGGVKEDYKECYLLDTGYVGSVPKALGIENFNLITYNGVAGVEDKQRKMAHQVFPRQKATSVISCLSSMMESSPKYWTQAHLSGKPENDNRRIMQTYSNEDMFKRAAILTQMVVAAVPLKRRPMRGKVISMGRGV